jgi:hypothetical protein
MRIGGEGPKRRVHSAPRPELDFGHFSENHERHQELSQNGSVIEKCLFFKILTQKWPKSSSEAPEG